MAGTDGREIHVAGQDEGGRERERGISRQLGRKVGQGGRHGQSPRVRQDVGGGVGGHETVYLPSTTCLLSSPLIPYAPFLNLYPHFFLPPFYFG